MMRTVTAMVLALALPGAGHFFLGERARGAAFFGIVAFMFLTGLAVDGGIYTVAASRGSLLALLASYASMGSGALYFLTNALGLTGDVMSPTFEYGTTFTLTAGLMNLLLVLDCFDIGQERKA
jgi:hypothetical protein